MAWLYVIMSVIISVFVLSHIGVSAGVCAFLTSAIVLIAGRGFKAMVVWGDTTQKIGGTVVAILLAAFAYWLSTVFRLGCLVSAHRLTGAEWGAIGLIIAFLWVNRRIAGRVLLSRPSRSLPRFSPAPTVPRTGLNWGCLR
jgi:hypothetical protein